MTQKYTAVVKQDAGWWIGWIEEVPAVNCQERTREELVETLRVTLAEAIDLNTAKVIEVVAVSEPSIEEVDA